MGSDLAEIDSISRQISEYTEIARQISVLHARSLEHANDEAIQQDNAQLAELTGQAADVQAQIRRRIQSLHARAKSGQLPKSTIQHANRVQEKFKAAIMDFQSAEKDFRGRYAQRVERQFRIVKSDATPEEIRAVTQDPDAGNQIFRTAMAQSGRYGEARLAYREAQDRNQEIRRIEQTITELGQLFNDMAVLIEEQDETIAHVEEQAKVANTDLERGGENVEKARDHAAAARRKRWYCFFISLLIIIAIVLAIAIPVALKNS